MPTPIDSETALGIVEDGTVTKIFVRANSHILTKHIDSFEQTQDASKINLLKKYWLEEYNAVLNIEQQVIIFSRKKDLTVFLLKWS
jgi:uncharacterized Fe-S cluster-containing MiaB family protein